MKACVIPRETGSSSQERCDHSSTLHQASIEAESDDCPDDWSDFSWCGAFELPANYRGPMPEWVERGTARGIYDGFKIFVGDLDSREQGEMISKWLEDAMLGDAPLEDHMAFSRISDINISGPNENSKWGQWKAS